MTLNIVVDAINFKNESALDDIAAAVFNLSKCYQISATHRKVHVH